MNRRWPALLYATAGLMFGNAVFSAVTGLAWPGRHYPDWAMRVTSAIFLLSAVMAGGAALGWWQVRRKAGR